jgi:hypothetical protein
VVKNKIPQTKALSKAPHILHTKNILKHIKGNQHLGYQTNRVFKTKKDYQEHLR